MSAEIIELKAELIDEKPIISNLADVQRRCLDLAEEYRKVGTISTYEDYQQAKRDRTMFNKAIKSIEDERRRVKTIWMAPYTTFEAGVKGALSPLREVADRNDAAIKTFEANARSVKKERLARYWEQMHPELALCTGEADEPLVPFDRVFESDWIKRLSELNDDRAPIAQMEEIVQKLESGAQVIADRTEPEHIKRYGLSVLYRTLDSDAAQRAMVQEMRRQNDIRELERAPEVKSIPSIEPPQLAPVQEPAVQSETQAACIKDIPARTVYVITITCETKQEAMRVKHVMQQAGIRGTIEKKEI